MHELCLAENETPTFFLKKSLHNKFPSVNILYFCAGAVRVSAPRNLLAGCPGD